MQGCDNAQERAGVTSQARRWTLIRAAHHSRCLGSCGELWESGCRPTWMGCLHACVCFSVTCRYVLGHIASKAAHHRWCSWLLYAWLASHGCARCTTGCFLGLPSLWFGYHPFCPAYPFLSCLPPFLSRLTPFCPAYPLAVCVLLTRLAVCAVQLPAGSAR
jgi:hypothetical protein